MPRTMRVEYPGAIYHVMDRGDRREDIVPDAHQVDCRPPADGHDQERPVHAASLDATAWEITLHPTPVPTYG